MPSGIQAALSHTMKNTFNVYDFLRTFKKVFYNNKNKETSNKAMVIHQMALEKS